MTMIVKRLMDFGNEADERTNQAESRVCELEEQFKIISQDLLFYKHHCQMPHQNTSKGSSAEQVQIDSLVTNLLGKDEVALAAGLTFLEATSDVEVCQRLLKMQNSLSLSTQNALALIAQFKRLQEDKDHLTTNLQRAEEDVKLLFEENNILNEENKRLMQKVLKERRRSDSAGEHNSTGSTK